MLITTYDFTVGEPAYVMNTSDMDWSPTLLLGHKKLDQEKIKGTQEKSERYHALKWKREEAASVEEKSEGTKLETVSLQESQQKRSCGIDTGTDSCCTTRSNYFCF